MKRSFAVSLLVWAAGLCSTASAEPLVAQPETFSLWKVPGGVFDSGQSWFDESSATREGSQADYWVLKIELVNLGSPNGDYSGVWQKVSSDCAGTNNTVLATIGVNGFNYEVIRDDRAGQPLILSGDSTEFKNARERACTAQPEPDPALRATIFANAVIWTRDPDVWAEDNAAK